MTVIQQNLNSVLSDLQGSKARLVAVSKFHPVEAILEAYEAGQRVFGENHVQELGAKQPVLPSDIEWHFIGHLQTNKVKYIVPYVKLIHSVDSMKLLAEIDKQAGKIGRRVDCLLQVHVAQEETKFGFFPSELTETLRLGDYKELKNVRLRGLMCMATNTDDERRVRRDFHTVKTLFDQTKEEFFHDDDAFDELSMGMSNDYKIAIEEGSTLVRIGSKIFGPRDYGAG